MTKLFRVVRIACAIGVTLSASACMSVHSYVDPGLGEPHYADLKKPANPQPIQLLFEFQTRGVANARATEALRARVLEQMTQSGLFSQVSYDPVPSGRKLSMTLDNEPLTDNAAAKGFGTGLTLGLVGSVVRDGYVCTTNYIEPDHDAVTTTVKHEIVSTIGNAAGPAGLTALSLQDAATVVVRQIVGRSLAEIDAKSDLSQ